jgi:hypothetical protein
MFVTRPAAWEQLQRRHEWVFSAKNQLVREIRENDAAVIYVAQRHGIVALGELVGEVTNLRSPEWVAGEHYGASAPIRYMQLYGEGIPLTPIVPVANLFAANRHRWGGVLQRSVIRVDEHDFALIRGLLATATGAAKAHE